MTADLLRWLAVGLPGFSVYLFALRGFYALKDTRTPFLVNLVENGIQIVLSFALVGRLRLPGRDRRLPSATPVAAVVALVALHRRAGRFADRPLRPRRAAPSRRRRRHGCGAARRGGLVDNSLGRRSILGAVVGGAVYLGVLVLLRSDDAR